MEKAVDLVTLVAGKHVIEVIADRSGSPESMIVSLQLDGRRRWMFEEPGRQDLGFGVTTEGTVVYWWSARHLVVMPVEDLADPQVMEVDDDIRFVFSVGEGWLLVCETSVRLIVEGQETSRLQAGEVLMSAHWQVPALVISDFNGRELKVEIVDGRLVL